MHRPCAQLGPANMVAVASLVMLMLVHLGFDCTSSWSLQAWCHGYKIGVCAGSNQHCIAVGGHSCVRLRLVDKFSSPLSKCLTAGCGGVPERPAAGKGPVLHGEVMSLRVVLSCSLLLGPLNSKPDCRL